MRYNAPMESSDTKQGAALGSVCASVALTTMKFVVGLMTGSIGILSEAAHSLLDFGAAALTYYSVKISAKPADEDHHYGHGKAESVSALIETGLLFLTSAFILYEAVHRIIWGGAPVEATWYAFAVIIVSIVIDFFRARSLMRVAKETKSQALEADALHFSSDILSSAAVLVGLVFVRLGFRGADAIAAIVVAVFVIRVAWNLGTRTIDVLVDAAPEGVADAARAILLRVPGVIAIEHVRVRPAGSFVSIDAVVTADRTRHEQSLRVVRHAATDALKAAIEGADVIVRVRPVPVSTETVIEKIITVTRSHGFVVHDVAVGDTAGALHVGLDLDLDGALTVAASHEAASHLEDLLKQELGQGTVVTVHIDPVDVEPVESSPVSAGVVERLGATIREAAAPIDGVREIHDISARTLGERLFISLNCNRANAANPSMSSRDIIQAILLALWVL